NRGRLLLRGRLTRLLRGSYSLSLFGLVEPGKGVTNIRNKVFNSDSLSPDALLLTLTPINNCKFGYYFSSITKETSIPLAVITVIDCNRLIFLSVLIYSGLTKNKVLTLIRVLSVLTVLQTVKKTVFLEEGHIVGDELIRPFLSVTFVVIYWVSNDLSPVNLTTNKNCSAFHKFSIPFSC